MKKNQGIKEMFASAIKEHQKNNLKTSEKFYKKILNYFVSLFISFCKNCKSFHASFFDVGERRRKAG